MSRFAVVNGLVLAATALTTSIGLADSTVVISIAGEAFDGPPAFQLLIGNKVIGSASLEHAIETELEGRLFANPRPSRFLEEFSFSVPDDSLLPDKEISIVLTNDKYTAGAEGESEDGFDRNLFIDFIRVNGHEVTSADMALTKAGEVQKLDYQAGLLPIYEAGQRVVAKPPAGGWPAPGVVPASMTDSGLPPTPVLASWMWQAIDRDYR